MRRILNRRNAIMGWLAWKATRRAVRRRIVRQQTTIRFIALASVLALIVGSLSVGLSRSASNRTRRLR